MKTVILYVVCGLLLVGLLFFAFMSMKLNVERKQAEKKAAEQKRQDEENNQKKDELYAEKRNEKESIDTGNDKLDFDTSISLLHDNSQKKRK